MIRKILLMLVMAILFNSIFVQAYSAQISKDVDYEKIRKQLVKILRSEKNCVKVKLNNRETIKGRLTAIDVDFFTLVENKSKASKNISYSDVKKS